ncbi:hypothetical protein MSG28_015120 [Choristoneura fumiferana]|uniref:Uncharacterized protein n=2 Tax=Choristoneura fumiferana TaxID=7141 RepID=A0ACC0KYF9_CHOFU|nr:hypothetical protein MSG28_015120 [Choristoneura fumiferana]
MSTLLFWQGKGKSNGAPNGRNWIHAPDALVKGHVAYLVKFLGCTQVDQPKGIEVVKEAIKKLQFTQQLKKSEAKDGAKCKKVEITISVDGVAIQEPRSNNIMYQFPLHRISYCADDKGAKKYFSFIAKGGSTESGHDEKHECFVFISTKLASEITLTIGQAFDLAYRRFMNDNGKYIEMQKLSLQNKKLELQMNAYKNRLQELSKITYKDDLSAYLARNNITDIAEFKAPADLEKQIASLTLANGFSAMNGTKMPENVNGNGHGQDTLSHNSSTDTFNSSNDNNLLLSTPPPQHNGKPFSTGKLLGDLSGKNPVVGTKLEGLLLNSDSDSDFDPRAFEAEPTPRYSAPVEQAITPTPPLLAPPPKASKRQNTPQQQQPPHTPHQTQHPVQNGNDLFGSTPFSVPQTYSPQITSPFAPTAKTNQPNYDISDFNLQTSVFNNTTSFTNGLSGYDAFDTQKNNNIFGNGFGNNFNGFGNLSEKQTVELDSNFNGFLDKTISDMKDGFSRGITFGNDDFSIDNLDPLKKN